MSKCEDIKSKIIGADFSAKNNGRKVSGSNFKIALNVIIWPVLPTSTVPSIKTGNTLVLNLKALVFVLKTYFCKDWK